MEKDKNLHQNPILLQPLSSLERDVIQVFVYIYLLMIKTNYLVLPQSSFKININLYCFFLL